MHGVFHQAESTTIPQKYVHLARTARCHTVLYIHTILVHIVAVPIL